jgi:hypothetical protein
MHVAFLVMTKNGTMVLATSGQLIQLFVTMLLFCEVGDEFNFFEKIWRLLVDDIQYNVHQTLNHETYLMSYIDL